jgi:hypothetical protein
VGELSKTKKQKIGLLKSIAKHLRSLGGIPDLPMGALNYQQLQYALISHCRQSKNKDDESVVVKHTTFKSYYSKLLGLVTAVCPDFEQTEHDLRHQQDSYKAMQERFFSEPTTQMRFFTTTMFDTMSECIHARHFTTKGEHKEYKYEHMKDEKAFANFFNRCKCFGKMLMRCVVLVCGDRMGEIGHSKFEHLRWHDALGAGSSKAPVLQMKIWRNKNCFGDADGFTFPPVIAKYVVFYRWVGILFTCGWDRWVAAGYRLKGLTRSEQADIKKWGLFGGQGDRLKKLQHLFKETVMERPHDLRRLALTTITSRLEA